MGITAANIIVGNLAVEKVTTVVDTPVKDSFKSLRERITPQEVSVEPINEPISEPTAKSPRRTRKSDKLIQYKESAFLSDMLSSSKD